MPKPILVVKYSPTYSIEVVDQLRESLQPVLEDYHTFIMPNNVEENDVRVFNGKYTEDDLITIKTFIEDLTKNYKPKDQ